MLRHASLSITAALVVAAVILAAPKQEYFADGELDMIRDAQELQVRVPLYLKLAERRLIALGLLERSEKEREKDRKEQQRYEKQKREAEALEGRVGRTGPTIPRVPGAPGSGPNKGPADPMLYLRDFTRPELLRGYSQAIDEVMSNIDDAYSRKLDVRGALEELEKFTRETLPVLEKYQPNDDGERSALSDAIDKAKEANTGAKDNLKIIPKTEKKPKG
jgi:hypothetical protein